MPENTEQISTIPSNPNLRDLGGHIARDSYQEMNDKFSGIEVYFSIGLGIESADQEALRE